MSFVSSYQSTGQTYRSSFSNFQTRPQVGQQQLTAYASASRAKRLGGLFEKLTEVINEAALTQFSDPQMAVQTQREYVEYVLARLRGDQTQGTPESLGEFAYELESLIDDILQAWEALMQVNHFMNREEVEQIDSIDPLLAILNRIASRRIESLMNNNWFRQWWDIHRKRDEAHEAALVESGDSVQENISNHNKSLLLELLGHASEMIDSNGIYLVSEEKRKGISSLLALLNASQSSQYN